MQKSHRDRFGWSRLGSAPSRLVLRLRRPWRGSSGQGMVEYSLILLLIAIVVIVILGLLGHRVSNMFSNVANGING